MDILMSWLRILVFRWVGIVFLRIYIWGFIGGDIKLSNFL